MKKYLLPLILTLILIFSANCFATAWEVDTAVYENKFKDVYDEETSSTSVAFKPDGSKMYVVGLANDTVYQYTLSTPWDVSTATYDTKAKDVGSQDGSPFSVAFKPDGSKMYIMGATNDTVYQYTLSPLWDVSTATYDTGKYKDVSSEDGTPSGVAFKPDGTKMYIVGSEHDTVYQYTLSTAWDVSSASYDTGKFKDVGDEDTTPYGVAFKPDGSKMYIMGYYNNTVYQYTLSTPWDVSSASYDSKYKDVGDEDIYPYSVAFKPDGSRMYIVGAINTTVFQYTLPVPPVAVNVIFFSTPF